MIVYLLNIGIKFFFNKSDFDLKMVSSGLLLVLFLVETWSDKSLILRFLVEFLLVSTASVMRMSLRV